MLEGIVRAIEWYMLYCAHMAEVEITWLMLPPQIALEREGLNSSELYENVLGTDKEKKPDE